MPDALQLLKTRRSLKPVELTAPGPSSTEIETLLTVASRVPDHGKLTPWRFIVFEGEARHAAGAAIAAAFRAKYPDAKPEHVEAERERLKRAPLVVAVVSRAGPHVKIPEWEQVLSCGAAAMNLVLAAHALGYGASWITEWYAYDRGVLDALGLTPHERIAGFVHIGRAPGPPEGRPRRARRSRPEAARAYRGLRSYRKAAGSARGSAAAAARRDRHPLYRLATAARLPPSGRRRFSFGGPLWPARPANPTSFPCSSS